MQVGLIVLSIRMQHRQITLGGDDSFLCVKYGLLTARRDTGCAFPWKMNLCTQERQLQSTPASAAYKELKKCLLPAETENLESWPEHHCCVFTKPFKSLALPRKYQQQVQDEDWGTRAWGCEAFCFLPHSPTVLAPSSCLTNWVLPPNSIRS